MIVADTPVWIDYFNGQVTSQTNLLDQLLGAELLLVGDLILAEILQGFRSNAEFDRALRHFEAFNVCPMVGREVAIAAAANHRWLGNIGVTVRKTIDVLIATFCIIEKHLLLHCDRDFDPFEQYLGLRVIRS